MKAIILFFLILVSAATAVVLGAFAPYHFYSKALYSGIDSRFYKIGRTNETYHKGSYYNIDPMNSVSSEAEDLWEVFHFTDFEIPLPVRHPMFVLLPLIEKRKERPVLGAVFKTRGGHEVSSFKVLESFKFDKRVEHHKLLELPFFKNYLLTIDDKTLWKDLFTRDLNIPSGKLFDLNYWKSLWRISYQELVYNLYILQLRSEFFPNNATNLSYYTNKSFGVIELVDKNKLDLGLEELFRTEIIYVYRDGFVHKLLLKTRHDHLISDSIRKRMMNALEYKPSDESSSIEIYARYKGLPYYKRVSQEGMIYLYAGWSHVTDKKEFLKEMIQFLERGNNSYNYLAPLYDYSYRKFGTNFSIIKNNLKESAGERLKRKAIEEERKQDEDIKNTNTSDFDGEFENEDKKVEYFLKKAKESEDSGENSNTLYKD
ncbi:hypothetical protein [Halobacteriovorax sp.]|uniref:hypothetical protein n=1 Tax=Halobacteriovorax sp. TaxID=2020862 RepID=UPI003563CCFF